MPDNSQGARIASAAPIAPLPHYWHDEPGRRLFVDRLFDGTAGEYDFVERLLGLGSGPRYRRDALRRAGLVPGMQVLDVATGTGLVAREIRALLGKTGSVMGLDPSAGMLGQAGQLHIPLVRALGEKLPFREGSFDFVSMGFALRHVADLEGLFREMHRVLRPGGTACILELTRPSGALASGTLQLFMTRIVPALSWLAGRRGGGELMRFYWDTIEACVAPPAVLHALQAGGFAAPQRAVSIGMFSEYRARKKA